MVISLALAVLLAYWSGDWSNVPINLGYVAGTLGLAVWPLYVMGRHRRRQDKVLDSIRALYLLAIGDLMTGRGRAAKRRLQKIRSLERHWRFGASYLFRTVLFGYVVVSNFVLATIGQFLGYHMNSPFHPRGLSDTWAMWLHAPWMFVVAGLAALFFSLPSALDTTHIKSRPWSEFYGDRLKAALEAGRGINEAPQHDGPYLPEGVTARELLGLSPNFTKAELRQAWLRLARQLHPDHWSASGDRVRSMKEAALKRVNAARDELLSQAI